MLQSLAQGKEVLLFGTKQTTFTVLWILRTFANLSHAGSGGKQILSETPSAFVPASPSSAAKTGTESLQKVTTPA